MKLAFDSLLLFLSTVIVLSTAEISLSVSEKEQLRMWYKYNVISMFGLSHDDFCTQDLSLEQTITLVNNIELFGRCCNSTIDTLFDKLDDDIKQADFHDPNKAQKFLPQLCEILDDALKCLRDFLPTLDFCVNDRQRYATKNLLTIAPMVVESACHNNGTDLLQLVQHVDGIKCVGQIGDFIAFNDIYGLFFAKPRNMETDCGEYNRLHTGLISRLDECSIEVSNLAKPILGQFCTATKCQEHIADVICK